MASEQSTVIILTKTTFKEKPGLAMAGKYEYSKNILILRIF